MQKGYLSWRPPQGLDSLIREIKCQLRTLKMCSTNGNHSKICIGFMVHSKADLQLNKIATGLARIFHIKEDKTPIFLI